MSRTRVLDTGVLIGIAVGMDQHRRACYNYAKNGGETYIPPTAWIEFQDRTPEIREAIADEINRHRRRVIQNVSAGEVSSDDLIFIKENILDPNNENRSITFLRRFYSEYAKTASNESVTRRDVTSDLNDMTTEVYDDASSSLGGLSSVAEEWSGFIPGYPNISSDLLIPFSKDKQICVQAHHIAVERGDAELATTNPRDFIDHRDGESESRKDNILKVTNLSEVVDLSCEKFP